MFENFIALKNENRQNRIRLILMMITLYKDDNTFDKNASLTYGPQFAKVGM